MPALFVALTFVLGLVVGSFLNVCILRIPARESIAFPASHCPKCGTPIKAYDNVPVLSWLVLRGRCRSCKAPISAMYPTVEFLSGAMFVACLYAFGPALAALKWAVFSAVLLVLAVTDLRERILPDRVNLTGAVLGLAFSGFVRVGDGTALWLSRHMFDFPPPGRALSVCDALLGAAAGSGVLWLFAEGYFRLRGHEGMGLGDVKMMGMAGTFLGTKAVLLTIMAGAVLGSVIGLAFMMVQRKDSDYELPFGLFLAAGGLLAVFFGPPLIAWYFSRIL
ncbi:MAG TPA: prepilin peptidase [Candidatus Acidoferrales bacterium]|nr:prepilin peptidase [Candidatus Acidoferrales bacterium]